MIYSILVHSDDTVVQEIRHEAYSIDDIRVVVTEVVKSSFELLNLLLLGFHSLLSLKMEELLLSHFSLGSSSLGGHLAKICTIPFQS